MRPTFKLMKLHEQAHNRLKAAASLEGKALQDFMDDLSVRVAEEKLSKDRDRRKYKDGFF